MDPTFYSQLKKNQKKKTNNKNNQRITVFFHSSLSSPTFLIQGSSNENPWRTPGGYWASKLFGLFHSIFRAAGWSACIHCWLALVCLWFKGQYKMQITDEILRGISHMIVRKRCVKCSKCLCSRLMNCDTWSSGACVYSPVSLYLVHQLTILSCCVNCCHMDQSYSDLGKGANEIFCFKIKSPSTHKHICAFLSGSIPKALGQLAKSLT